MALIYARFTAGSEVAGLKELPVESPEIHYIVGSIEEIETVY
mgnify:CR=1 FL=1